ncbi:OapA family protein [Sulfurirhabdus autotrophica]|uniref:Murein DD-endopeptidase MepM/ murein hydrolase activator NlpD n=1 Tax=Sulfurirhabdus autotrophica TaxID=1706046 RepID=A0A4R3Y1T8_9PROT|nr:M23 family metallopeptidase [Sulfurirhabdus autotrophica]TCV84658.1 murein DD-endopeptidase MepM/ murein hydrolase activator NlpD [Sulfurirhabdus autotrophica]
MNNIEDAILTQKQNEQERKFGLRWLVGLSSIPLFGIVAAFGIAPQTDTGKVSVQTIIEQLPLPTAKIAEESNSEYWRAERIQRGDTVAGLLSRLKINDPDALSFLNSSKDASTLYQLRPGKIISAQTNNDGELLTLRYIHSDGTMLQVEKDGDSFKAKEEPVQLENRVSMKSGEIKSSLFAATDAINLPDSIAVQMADMFSTDVDFHQDLRKGDRFTVVYESFYNNGEPVKTGRILAAEFTNQGKTYRAVYFQDKQGHGGYYTPEGKNLRKAFLRSPLEFSRISSGFTTARYHPILQKWRAHKGVDYAAPTGTRIKAVADATVAFIGTERGYGNFILLQHQGKFSTAYGHLSAFAKGLHRGSKVNQGDVIGFVGMTGLATGPHLHYEFRIAGVQHNPLSVDMPVAFPIAAAYKHDFDNAVAPLMTRLSLLRGTNLASLD